MKKGEDVCLNSFSKSHVKIALLFPVIISPISVLLTNYDSKVSNFDLEENHPEKEATASIKNGGEKCQKHWLP